MTCCLTGPHRSRIHSPMIYIGQKKSRRSGNLPPQYQMIDPISPDYRYRKTNASFVVLPLNRTPRASHRCLFQVHRQHYRSGKASWRGRVSAKTFL
jgi:hypothetical protein